LYETIFVRNKKEKEETERNKKKNLVFILFNFISFVFVWINLSGVFFFLFGKYFNVFLFIYIHVKL